MSTGLGIAGMLLCQPPRVGCQCWAAARVLCLAFVSCSIAVVASTCSKMLSLQGSCLSVYEAVALPKRGHHGALPCLGVPCPFLPLLRLLGAVYSSVFTSEQDLPALHCYSSAQ